MTLLGNLSLHLIVDTHTPLALVEAALAEGLDAVQLRDKGASAQELYRAARRIRTAVRQADAVLIVNDRLDVALAVDADGVHLAQKSLPARAARRVAPDLLIGASVHSLREALMLAPHVDYLTFGSVFPTQSHPGQPAKGIQALREVVRETGCPILAIGGITPENVAEVAAAGAAGVVVLSAIRGGDVASAALATRRLRRALDRQAVVPMHQDPSIRGGAYLS